MVAIVSSVVITSFFVADGPASATVTAGSVQTGEALTIALARTPGGSREWRTYASAIRRMGEAVGRPMHLRYVDSRAEMVELLRTGSVDAAFLCTYCYLQVADEPGVTLVAAPVIAGHSKDAAVLVVTADSAYATLADLRGHRVGVTEPTSLAGYAYLRWLATSQGIESADAFILVPRDSQEQSIRALTAGEVDAVVVNRSQLASWQDAGLRVIATSPEFGMPPFVTGRTIDAATRDTMQLALLAMRPSSEVTPTSIQGFVTPVSRDYDFARTLERYAGPMEGAE